MTGTEKGRKDVEPERKRGFLVAKHILFRQSLALLLELRRDFEIAQAGSLTEARRVLGNQAAEPDFAVIDLELSNSDGFELIGEIREAWPRVPVLALTTRRDPKRAARAKQAGAGEVFNMTAASSEELLKRVGGG